MSKKLLAGVLLECLTGIVFLLPLLAQGADVAVVVNPKSAVSNVTVVDLRKFLTGEKRTWPGGVPVKVILRGGDSHERLVLLKLVGMSASEYKQSWTAQVFRGEADAEPFAAPSIGMALEATRAFPGAIFLMDAPDVKPGMKVIKVDGHMPGEAGYPLH